VVGEPRMRHNAGIDRKRPDPSQAHFSTHHSDDA
jgi:hypothetical protein